MAKYLITYDLNKPGQDYSGLYVAIKEIGSWMHPLDSTWFVETSQTAASIRDALAKKVDGSDKVFVTPVSGWASFNLAGLANWLAN